MKSKSSVIFAALVAWSAAVTAHAQPAPTGMQLPVLVDGSKTPGQIPDSLAYKHYLRAISVHQNPSPPEQKRQDAQFHALGLSPKDKGALAAVLAQFRSQFDLIEGARATAQTGAQEDAL